MINEKITELLQTKEPLVVLALCTKAEVEELQKAGLPVEGTDTFLSMQHLKTAQAKLKQNMLTVLAATPNEAITTEAERALIYAMLVRCRKVISCRDKLEDMLKYDDREGWYDYKAEYETKVLDMYKATWRSVDIYPYIIVDNIKKYNKEESYILRDLYYHLSERTPGKINPGDVEMTNQLRQMFTDIGLNMLQPDVVLVGDIDEDKALKAALEHYPEAKIIKL